MKPTQKQRDAMVRIRSFGADGMEECTSTRKELNIHTLLALKAKGWVKTEARGTRAFLFLTDAGDAVL